MNKTTLCLIGLFILLTSTAISQPETNEVLKQWAHERFGMFIHFGAYSDPAGVWRGKTVENEYAEQLMQHFRIPIEIYKKEIVAPFNPTEFDADDWVRILKDAGMGYLVITAKHCDGFAMYDSDVTDYDIIDATQFGRDPIKELKAACDREGVLFGLYYNHAQDWSHPDGVRNDWDFDGPMKRAWWKTDTNYCSRIRNYYDEKAIPQLLEMVEKYDPDILWFDTAGWGPIEYNMECADLVLKAKPNLIINSRAAWGYKATFKSTNDKPVEFPHHDGYWEAIPAINQSYGYHKRDHTHYPASYLIQLIIKAAAKGGNMLMNVGPKGDGTIDMVDQGVLAGIGKWMKTNGEAIKGTDKSPLPSQSFGEVTRKGNTLYCHVFQWPKDGKLVVSGLKSNVQKAVLFTDPERKPLDIRRINETDVEISLPIYCQEKVAAVVALECDVIEVQEGGRLLLQNVDHNRLHVTDAALSPGPLVYAGGNWRTDFLKGWSDKEASVTWDIRANEPGTYDLFVSYDAESDSDGNQFEILIGDNLLTGIVIPGIHRNNLYVGRVTLEAASYQLRFKPKQLKEGFELMKLRDVKLIPVK